MLKVRLSGDEFTECQRSDESRCASLLEECDALNEESCWCLRDCRCDVVADGDSHGERWCPRWREVGARMV